jgi:3-dehydroquinate synthase
MKNRLGAYHEPLHTIVDRTFLRTLPQREIRNGIAEILKITSCTNLPTFELLEQYGESLIADYFGREDGKIEELPLIADRIIRQSKHCTRHFPRMPWPTHLTFAAIKTIVELEAPNSREQDLNRVMFFGHTWSPNLELVIVPHLMHGHAISVDMCYSATLAYHLGRISKTTHERFLGVFSRLGLTLDHPAFTLELLKEATMQTIATRDGKLRAPIPTGELGTYEILQQVEETVLADAWKLHKESVEAYPRKGQGLEMTIAYRVPN